MHINDLPFEILSRVLKEAADANVRDGLRFTFGLSQPQSAIGEVSVGSSDGARRITNVAAGRDAGDAVNVAQLTGAVRRDSRSQAVNAARTRVRLKTQL